MRINGCEIIRRGARSAKKIAFTFDDGPHPDYSLKIADIIEKNNGRATFFATGENLRKHPETARELINRGHMLGNHSFGHRHSLFAKRAALFDSINETKCIIEDITGEPNTIFRPPYGFITPAVLSICRDLELSIVLWTSNSKDYKIKSAERIVKKVSSGILPGAIILFHDCKFSDDSINYDYGRTALKMLMGDVIFKGLTMTTVAQLIESER
ncbi:MAG: polysaccharide deacetylase family protein [candidate division Zixibacteria bacterium]|nr:polysaccharide deacetylase family protein [candidate division Zixibacteria bacterium]